MLFQAEAYQLFEFFLSSSVLSIKAQPVSDLFLLVSSAYRVSDVQMHMPLHVRREVLTPFVIVYHQLTRPLDL